MLGWSRTLAGEWKAAPRTVQVVVVVQILAILVAGCLTAYEYRPWSVDESAHYDYVEYVAREGRLPVLGRDLTHDDVLALSQGRYPQPTTLDPRTLGVFGQSYEAFQPPLYYLAVAPFWFVTRDAGQRYKVLRLVGVGFLLATVLVLLVLCRLLVGARWPMALGFGLLVLLAPGVLLRSATIGNAALEPLVATTFIVLCVLAWRRLSYRWLVLAAVGLGLCLLTRLVLGYLVPVFVGVAVAVWWRRGRRSTELPGVVGAGLIPLAMLAPWLIFNRVHYQSWTASELARRMQQPIINPRHVDYTLLSTLKEIPTMTDFGIPQEWRRLVLDRPWIGWSLGGLAIVVIPLTIVLIVAFRNRSFRDPRFLLCLAPLPIAIGALCVSTAVSNWPQAASRYTFGALPAWGVAAYCVYRHAFVRDREFARFLAVLTVLTLCAMGALLYVAYFTSVTWKA